METPEPTELIYLPRASWTPALLGAGLAGLIVGLFTWFPYAIIAGAVALLALRKWLKGSISDILHLPRHQQISTSPIPLTGVAREKRSETAV